MDTFGIKPPEGAHPLPLGDARNSAGNPFQAFGYPAIGDFIGLGARGTIITLVQDNDKRSMLQLTCQQLAPGMSGAPVWDEAAGRVVGMVSLAYNPGKTGKFRDAAFATPAETLRQACPELAAVARKVENPFFVGGRINDPRHFFGRERLVREIRAELKKRASISLVGASQMGKSSLLYYLYATRAEWLPGATLEYVDLQRVLDEADFCETVLAQLGETGDTLRHLKRAVEKRVLGGQTVVLLLDEVERIAEQDFNPRLHDLLRSLSQEKHFAMCLSTQRPLVEVFPARTPGGVSPFHNIFTTKTIRPFTEAEARAFLAARLAGTGITFPPHETARLLSETRGHPAKLQRMAKALFHQYPTPNIR